MSFGEKNNLRKLKHRNLRQKRIKHYANDKEPAMCLICLYKEYLEKCPKTAVQGNNVFYLTPRQKYKSTDEGITPINVTLHGKTVNKVNARARHVSMLKQKERDSTR